MDTQLIGQKEDPLVRGYMETMLVLCLANGKLDGNSVHQIVRAAHRHPCLKHLTHQEVVRLVRHSLLVMDKQDFEEQLLDISALLPTREACCTAMDLAISVAWSDGEMKPKQQRRLLELQLFMGLSDEEVEGISDKYR